MITSEENMWIKRYYCTQILTALCKKLKLNILMTILVIFGFINFSAMSKYYENSNTLAVGKI